MEDFVSRKLTHYAKIYAFIFFFLGNQTLNLVSFFDSNLPELTP